MNFLFTIALNNTQTASRYKSMFIIFNALASSLIALGHNVHIVYNPKTNGILDAKLPSTALAELNFANYKEMIDLIGFIPDYAFIWNGNLDSDKITIATLKDNNVKMVYGELGFFNHYKKTCYFDLAGVNCRSSLMVTKLNHINLNEDNVYILEKLYADNVKPRLQAGPYIFVPLQVETDTQITNYSPFKTMDEFLEYVDDLFKNDTRPILFKQHPKAKSIVKEYDKFIEVTEDVHHYLPYADLVIGINSTVLTETLLYHTNIITVGAGISARNVSKDERKKYVLEIYSRQLNWEDLRNPEKVENSYLYKQLMRNT